MAEAAAIDEGRLLRFVSLIAETLMKVDPGSGMHPARAHAALTARRPAQARRGLGMAVNDMVEMTAGLPRGDVDRLDALLAAADAATLSEVRSRFGVALKAVMRRGLIRSEGEYHLVRNGAEIAAESETGKLWSMLAAFEQKAAIA